MSAAVAAWMRALSGNHAMANPSEPFAAFLILSSCLTYSVAFTLPAFRCCSAFHVAIRAAR